MTTDAALAGHHHQSRTASVVQHCRGLNFFCHDTAARQLQDKHWAIGAVVVIIVVTVLVLLMRRAWRKARAASAAGGRRGAGQRTTTYPYRR